MDGSKVRTCHRSALCERDVRAGSRIDGGVDRFSSIVAEFTRVAPFAECVRGGVGTLDVLYVPVTWIHRQQILDLATRNRLPAVYWHRGYVLGGGLMSYGADEREVPKRLAGFVDKILRGAKPTDLPVEQPDRFELVINLRPPRRSASRSRHRCWRGRIRSSSDATIAC